MAGHDSGAARSHTSTRVEAARATAALAVVAYHLQVVTHGYAGDWSVLSVGARVLMTGQFGVAVFFGLSGFLLFRPHVRSALGGERVDLRRYLVNRVLRILPLYYAAVLLLLLVQGLPGGWDAAWRHLLFVQYLSPTVHPVDGPLWSLVCEVQFYALLPLMGCALSCFARQSSGRALVSVATFGVIAWALSRWALTQAPYSVWNFSLAANLVYFVPGMLLATVLQSRFSVEWLRVRGTLTVACLAGIAFVCWLLLLAIPNRDGVLVAATVSLAALTCWDRVRPASAARRRPIAYLGLRSYSLYVWHLPIIAALAGGGWFTGFLPHDALIAVPLCIAAALLSYVVVETPFLRMRRGVAARLSATRARTAFVAVPDTA